jgi:DDE superfamily endonuclease/Homeodomain-like domain
LRSKGLTLAEVADFLEISVRTVCNIEDNYAQGGLLKALHDDPRPGAPVQFDDRVKSHVVATVCSEPPEGFDRWTLELIREEIVQRAVVKSISTETIRLILQEHDLKPWRQQSWCVPKLDAQFIARMEDILALYERPLDPQIPLLCLDEKPIQLLEDVRPPSGIVPGRCKRVDYEYKRNGICNVFCAVEPRRGKYFTEVTSQRRAEDFARFLAALARRYASSQKILLVLDNLNTHRLESLLGCFGQEKAKQLWERFEIHYTPKHGSWLNQAEIAINIYARQCLGRSRIPDRETLRKRTKAWTAIVNRRKVTINWHFTRQEAREKFDYD